MNDRLNADPVCIEFDINQLRVAEIYYYITPKIDETNRTRKDYFHKERKLQTKDWSIKVNTSILGMDDVDIYYLGKACDWSDVRNPVEFYYNITEEMIDNRWTKRRTRRNQVGQPIEYTGYIRNIVPRCTPTK